MPRKDLVNIQFLSEICADSGPIDLFRHQVVQAAAVRVQEIAVVGQV